MSNHRAGTGYDPRGTLSFQRMRMRAEERADILMLLRSLRGMEAWKRRSMEASKHRRPIPPRLQVPLHLGPFISTPDEQHFLPHLISSHLLSSMPAHPPNHLQYLPVQTRSRPRPRPLSPTHPPNAAPTPHHIAPHRHFQAMASLSHADFPRCNQC